MAGRSSKALTVVLLIAFFLVVVGIDFFHTEPLAGKDPRCPACHFQNSAHATVPADAFDLPAPADYELLSLHPTSSYENEIAPSISARAPPLA
jgi:hypothetical protein